MGHQDREAEDWRKRREAEDREFFIRCIKEMEEDMECGIFTKEMPPPNIVKHHDLLDKLWGWDRLLPRGYYVSWPDYCNYLKAYHCRNVDAISSVSDLAKTCFNSEEQLVTEWRIKMKPEDLPMRRSIILSCLIHERLDSLIHTGCISSDVSAAALLCIAKEADLTCQLLRRGVDPDDGYMIDPGREIRTCALGLMNCTSANSVAASAVLLGMAREAEMICAWMSKSNKPFDISDYVPDEILDSRLVRYEILYVMIDILEESSSSSAAAWHKIDKDESASRNGPGGDEDDIAADGAANTAGVSISDVLNSHYKKKIKVGEKRKKKKMKKEDLLEKVWGWERLLPPSGSVKWVDYTSYLEQYYKRNASEFVAGALANQNPEDSQIANNSYMRAYLVRSCLKMEDELLSEWKTRVIHSVNDTLAVSTIIQSSLIKELALSICSAGAELSTPEVAFVCITKEADLMYELLKHGAKPFDDIIQQSIVIRMCALGLANLKGHASISAAAVMMGMAYEAKKMCDLIKREKKLVTFSLSEPHHLECCLIRIKALGVMTSILQDSSLPCNKMEDDDAMGSD